MERSGLGAPFKEVSDKSLDGYFVSVLACLCFCIWPDIVEFLLAPVGMVRCQQLTAISLSDLSAEVCA